MGRYLTRPPLELLGALMIASDEPVVADAIVYLEGDYWSRLEKTIALYRQGFAKKIVVSGGLDAPERGCFPAHIVERKLRQRRIPASAIILEESSLHTADQAREVVALAKRWRWRRLILVASHFHQVRAYLTFLKQVRRQRAKVDLYNAPERNLPWFATSDGASRYELLGEEFKKIKRYKNDVATFAELIAYLKQRERSR